MMRLARLVLALKERERQVASCMVLSIGYGSARLVKDVLENRHC